MNMIWHDQIAADQPRWISLPTLTKQAVSFLVIKDVLPILRAYRYEDDIGDIEAFVDSGMDGVLSAI